MVGPVESAADALGEQVWKTYGSRLSAHRRLVFTHALSTWTIAIASVYVIGVSVAALVVEPSGELFQLLGVVAAVSATAILALSLVEAGQRYEVRAERLHECALELGELLGELDLFKASDAPELHELQLLRERYSEILRNHKENHAPFDYRHFKATRPHEFEIGRGIRSWIVCSWYLAIVWRYAIVIIAPPIAIVAGIALR